MLNEFEWELGSKQWGFMKLIFAIQRQKFIVSGTLHQIIEIESLWLPLFIFTHITDAAFTVICSLLLSPYLYIKQQPRSP